MTCAPSSEQGQSSQGGVRETYSTAGRVSLTVPRLGAARHGQPHVPANLEGDAWARNHEPANLEGDAWARTHVPANLEGDAWARTHVPANLGGDAWGMCPLTKGILFCAATSDLRVAGLRLGSYKHTIANRIRVGRKAGSKGAASGKVC